jgi:hypothetical protein
MTRLVVGFRSSDVVAFLIHIHFLVNADYCLFRLFLEYETVMSEDRNGLYLEPGHVYMVELGLRKA